MRLRSIFCPYKYFIGPDRKFCAGLMGKEKSLAVLTCLFGFNICYCKQCLLNTTIQMDGILQAGVSRKEAGRQDHKERKPKKLKTTEHCCKAPSKSDREIQGFHPLM